MPINAVDLGTLDASDQFKIALVGPEKSGKSRLLVTGRKPLLNFDFDGRRESIAGNPGAYAISFQDEPWPKMPSTLPEFQHILSQLEKCGDLSLLTDPKGQKLFPTAPPETMIATAGIDSGFSFGRAAMKYILFNNKDLRYTVAIAGVTEVHTPKSWAGWGSEVNVVDECLQRLFALGIDVILTLHETSEEAADSTQENPRFTGRQTVYPVRYKNLIKYFNEVWRLSRMGQEEPKVTLVPEYNFASAATALLLDPVERPNISDMIAKHKQRVQSGWKPTVKQAQLTAPASPASQSTTSVPPTGVAGLKF